MKRLAFAGVVFSLLAACKPEEGGGGAPSQGSADAARTWDQSQRETLDTAVNGHAKCPVCMMRIEDASAAPHEEYRHATFYFCSAADQATFHGDPSHQKTGLPGESCLCSGGGMENCRCGHCRGQPQRCPCAEGEFRREGHENEGEGHDDGH